MNGRDAYDVRLPMPYTETRTLTKERAIELARSNDHYSSLIASRPLKNTQFMIYGSLKVELDFIVEEEKRKKEKKKTTASR